MTRGPVAAEAANDASPTISDLNLTMESQVLVGTKYRQCYEVSLRGGSSTELYESQARDGRA
jgi:hypothetical protein